MGREKSTIIVVSSVLISIKENCNRNLCHIIQKMKQYEKQLGIAGLSALFPADFALKLWQPYLIAECTVDENRAGL